MIEQAVILAAGYGKRMMPLTKHTPKALLKVAGKPLISYALTNLKELGIKEVIIIVGHLKEQIINYLSDYKDIAVKFVTQEKKIGTAYAIGLAKPYIQGDFLVLNGDILLKKKAILNLLLKHIKGEISILSEQVEDARQYGVLILNKGKIVDLIEKPQNPQSNLINAGVYIFPIAIFDAIKQTTLSPRGELEITDSIKILINSGIAAQPIICARARVELTKPSDIKKAENWLMQNSLNN